jgi:O-antigen ligase
LTGRLITDHSSSEVSASGAKEDRAGPGSGESGAADESLEPFFGGVTALGVFAAIATLVLCLAYSSSVSSQTFTPKFAVLLLFAAVGIVPFARLVRSGSRLRWPARAALAFLIVAVVSALTSPAPTIGFFGLYLWGTGWLLWLGAAGAFSIGASLGPADRRWVFGALLVGALGNSIVAVAQILVHASIGSLSLYDGAQADGLLGNPIYLEALSLGVLALILGRVCRSPLRWGAAVVLLTAGLEFTSERLAVVLLIVLVLYAVYSYGVRRGGVFTLLIAAGYGIAYVSGRSVLGSRVASGTNESTFGVRLRIWVAGAHYLVHHPWLGVGPGEFRTAMDSTATLSFFQHVLSGRILTDGHDIFVEIAVTTGVLGLVCFLCWLFGSARLAVRGAFLGFAATMFAVEIVEPLNVAILPLAFLGLGLATAVLSQPEDVGGDVPRPREQTRPTVGAAAPHGNRLGHMFGLAVSVVAVAAALVVGATAVIGDVYLARATDYGMGRPFNYAAARDAARLLPYWPESALAVAQVDAFDSVTTPGQRELALLADSRHWTDIAVGRDPTNPRLWTLLGSADVELDHYRLGRAELYRALACDPWYTQAFEGLGQMEGDEGHWVEAVHYYRLAIITVEADPPDLRVVQRALSGAESAERAQQRRHESGAPTRT